MKTQNRFVRRLCRILYPAVLILFLSGHTVSAQVGYTYDKAGNRISCYILKMASAGIQQQEELVEHFAGPREVKLHPNPTKGQLILSINGGEDEEDYNISLFNMSGHLLLQQQRTGNGTFEMNIENQPSGTYILILATKEDKIHYKIIKN